jgi:hypothetical protein
LLTYSVLNYVWEKRRLHTRLISGKLRSAWRWLNDGQVFSTFDLCSFSSDDDGQVSNTPDFCSSSSDDDDHWEEMSSGWRGLFSYSSDDEEDVISSGWPEWDDDSYFKI